MASRPDWAAFLLSNLAVIHSQVVFAIAQLIVVEPGDRLVLVDSFPERGQYQQWRVVEFAPPMALLRSYQETRLVDLSLARVWRVADGVADEPHPWVPLGDGSMLFVGPWLSYATPDLGNSPPRAAPMSLSQFYKQPLYGWVDWTIGLGVDETTIQLSNVYPPFQDIWLWCMHIAAGCLPCTLIVDTEGFNVYLGARRAPGAGDDLMVSIQETGRDAERLARMPRQAWLALIGKTFGDFFAADYIPSLWDYDDDDPEPPDLLPWCQPARLCADAPVLPPSLERAMLWLRLAWWSHQERAGRDYTDPVALGPYLARCQMDALTWAVLAWLAAKEKLPESFTRNHLRPMRERLTPDLLQAFALGELAIDRFRAECEAVDARCMDRFPSVTRLQRVIGEALHQVSSEVTGYFPADTAGLGVRTPAGDWGELLRAEGGALWVDWGERGIERCLYFKHGLVVRHLPEGLPIRPDSALHRRSRRFVSDAATAGFPVCPCCGYPAHEADPELLESCRFCGWEPWRMGVLPEMDAMLEMGGRRYSLRGARRNYVAHGDMFDAEDASDEARAQRMHAVVAAKCEALRALEAWLETGPNRSAPAWEAWERLDTLIFQILDSWM